jgi:hypothetical protein
MKQILCVALLASILSGCGWFDRKIAAATGGPSKTCVDGVLYLQFTSGASVAYNPDGTVKTCGDGAAKAS